MSSSPPPLEVPEKVIIWFRPTGNAPILKQSKFKITSSQKFTAIMEFLRKQLRFGGNENLFLYVNSTFSPALDENISNLYKCFNADGMLIVNYSITAAWG